MSRKVIEHIEARPASDGDGVKLFRVFGGQQPRRFDPFLMMDEFGSDSADDYIGGFPPHPHRGFCTITYMLQGKMEHRDHMNNVGLLQDGDVQWMAAGRGVIHSEMPQQTEGLMRGFQIWLNLPASHKMMPANYEDIAAAKIPVYTLENITVKAIAGNASVNTQKVEGYIQETHSFPVFLDIHVSAGGTATVTLPEGHNAMLYIYDGALNLGEENIPAQKKILSRFSEEGSVNIHNSSNDIARCILLAGKAFNEPVAQYGPFVMNTPEEINQAIEDFRSGNFIEDAQQ